MCGNKIHLLPEVLYSKIAAGEVIQKPASIVKELLENSIDAHSSEIILKIEEGGKTLIQVIDNGVGMSKIDAKMCLQNHATSKIKKQEDLYNIKTMGFRGEAITSIATVAQVEIITKTEEDYLGIKITVNGEIKKAKEEPIQAKRGTIFTAKNIFFNIPARRSFLKTDHLELGYIIKEFQHIALSHPNIDFTFINNNEIKYKLQPKDLLGRISDIFGDKNEKNLLRCDYESEDIKISGFISNVDNVKKNDNYFLFVNDRFVKNNAIQKEINKIYREITNQDNKAFYVLFIYLDPHTVDVNVHPSKMEIKFENDEIVCETINKAIKKTLYSFDFTDFYFDKENSINLQAIEIKKHDNTEENTNNNQKKQLLFCEEKETNKLQEVGQNNNTKFLLIGGTHIISATEDGIIIINIQRAIKRLLYDEILEQISKNNLESQQLLVTQKIQVDKEAFYILKSNINVFNKFGFTFKKIDDENKEIEITGIPKIIDDKNQEEIIEDIILAITKDYNAEEINKKIALKILNKTRKQIFIKDNLQIQILIGNLSKSVNSMFDPYGKRIWTKAKQTQIDTLLN